MDGYIKLYRKIENWQWYRDSSTLHVFIDLLLDANFEDSKEGFIVVKRGQCLTSLKRLQERTGLTFQQIRTSLSKLERSGEINKQTTNRHSIITIKRYDEYQNANNPVTSKQQTTNNIKEYKEYKEIKKEENIKEEKIKKFIRPTIDEIFSYCNERKNNIDANAFYDYYESNGWVVGKNKMKDWKATIRNWERNSKKKDNETSKIKIEQVGEGVFQF